MSAPFQHFAELTAGSVAEAIMNTTGGGQDGHFWTVPQGQVCRIRIAVLDSEQAAGVGRFRIRQSQVPPAGGVIPTLVATDPIVGAFFVPLGAAGVEDIGSQPLELPGGAGATGTNYYVTIQQAGGAAFAAVNLQGAIG